jgi:hypothetical protein
MIRMAVIGKSRETMFVASRRTAFGSGRADRMEQHRLDRAVNCRAQCSGMISQGIFISRSASDTASSNGILTMAMRPLSIMLPFRQAGAFQSDFNIPINGKLWSAADFDATLVNLVSMRLEQSGSI